jgi:hypothetical protein
MNLFRYCISPILGICTAFIVCDITVQIFPGCMSLSVAVIFLALTSGFVGGMVVGIISPDRKLILALFTGLGISSVLFGLMVMCHMIPLGRNLILWYWPAWIFPGFFIGGFAAKLITGKTTIK